MAVVDVKDSTEAMKAHVEEFLAQTEDGRALAEKCRDYYDSKQWSEQEASKLRSRGQAPIVVNRIKSKVEGLKGLYAMRTSDPKAYPRTQKHEKASHAMTDALRFVADQNDFNSLKDCVAENLLVEGYGGAIVDVRQTKKGDINIRIAEIPWDRIYFDPHSRKRDFSDARYIGQIMWMDEAEVSEFFPDFDADMHRESNEGYETFEDRPRWITHQGKRKRYRVAYEFYIQDGQWMMCIFTGGGYLVKPQVSPFIDDEGEPCCPIELVSAYVDRSNNRYSEVAAFLDLQDEINHRRSKALHLLSQRQTFGRKGEQKDIAAIKRELSKPNGHVEFIGEEFGKDFGILPTSDMAQGQFELLMEAKGEIDSVSYNAQLAGERQQGDLSGKAIDRLQKAGTIELNSLYNALNWWEKRVYRQIWARVKQFWNEEKWIRVTDDQDNLRWVGLNSQVTVEQLLLETIKDTSKPKEMQLGASAMLQQMQQNNDPYLQEVVEVRNPVAEIDVDIILDQSFDTVNIQQEQFEILAKFGQSQDIDIIELIELSQIRGKDQLIEKIEKRRAAAAESATSIQKIEAEKAASEIALNNAKAQAEIAKLQNPMAELDMKREIAAEDRKAKMVTELQKAEIDAFVGIEKAKLSAKPTTMIQVDGKQEIERMTETVQQSMAGLPEVVASIPMLVNSIASTIEASNVAAQNVAQAAAVLAETASKPKPAMQIRVEKQADGSMIGEAQPVQ